MGSDCSSFHQERSHTMRWGYLALILLVTVAGVQLLEEENAEFALNNLSESEGKQSLADAILPLVKRETEKKSITKKTGQKKKSKKDRKKKRSRNVGQTEKNGNGGKKGSRKVGKKGGKGGINKRGSKRKNNRKRNC